MKRRHLIAAVIVGGMACLFLWIWSEGRSVRELENQGEGTSREVTREAGWLIQDEPARWMSCFYRDGLADRLTLKDLCLPASHDSGAYRVLGFFNKATAPWVVTQDLSLGDQLRAGVRVLDLRVKKVSAKEAKKNRIEAGYYIHHGGYLTIPLSKALEDLAGYFASEDARNETLLCEFSHFHEFEEGELEPMIDELEKSLGDHLFVNETGESLMKLPLSNYRGKIVALIDAKIKSRPGFYELGGEGALEFGGSYANSDEVDEMISNQAGKFSKFDDEDALFTTSWTLTPQYGGGSLPRSVRAMTKEAHAKLVGSFLDEKLPFGQLNEAGRIVNVINLDFYEEVSDEALRLCERVMSRTDWAEGEE